MKAIIFAASALAFAAACAEPAALRVTIDVREADLAAVRIAVARDADSGDKSLLACTFPAGKRVEDGCLLEGGTPEWKGDREPLAFILYGRPGTDLVVGAAGLREADAIAVATSTEASVTLPDHGEEEELTLVLVARTSMDRFCTAEISAGGNDRSGLSAFDLIPTGDERKEIIASTGNTLAVLEYEPLSENCRLVAPRAFPETERICPILENSLIAAPAPFVNGGMMAALCFGPSGPAQTEVRLRVLAEEDPNMGGSVTSSIARSNFSRPAFADLNGDRRPELYMVRAERPLHLAGWRMGGQLIDTIVELDELFPNNLMNPQMNVGPLVVFDPRAGRDTLIIAGYNGGMSVVTGGNALRAQHVLTDVGMGTLAPAAVVLEDEQFLLVQVVMMHGLELRVTVLEGNNDDWNLIEQFMVPAPPNAVPETDRDVRLAIGDIDGSGQLVAVTVQNGRAFIYPLKKNAAARTMDIWSGIMGVQSVLLANLDGSPGAEIIAFDADSPNIHAVTSDGRELDGWPLVAPEGGNTRVVLAELDPPNAPVKNMEVITMSQRTVKVFSLGPGSYDPNETPWPMRDQNAAAGAVLQKNR